MKPAKQTPRQAKVERDGRRFSVVRADSETACEVVAPGKGSHGLFMVWQQGDPPDYFTAYDRDDLITFAAAIELALAFDKVTARAPRKAKP